MFVQCMRIESEKLNAPYDGNTVFRSICGKRVNFTHAWSMNALNTNDIASDNKYFLTCFCVVQHAEPSY